MARNFVYRLTVNSIRFLVAIGLYSVAFVVHFFIRVDKSWTYMLSGTFMDMPLRVEIVQIRGFYVTPILFLAITAFVFYVVLTKSFPVQQEYRMGFARTTSYYSMLGVASIYGALLSVYAVSFALVFRTIYLSVGNKIVFWQFYEVTAWTYLFYCFFGFAMNLLIFEFIHTIRNIRLKKFWIGEALCLACFGILCFSLLSFSKDALELYLIIIMISVCAFVLFDYVQSRGSQA